MSGDLMQTSPHGPMIWKVMQRNVWSDMASWLAKQLSSFTKSQLHALMTIHFKEAELGCVGELSVNTLVRSVTKWTRPCDKCLACLISYIHHTNDYRQYCRLCSFQDSDFAGDLEDSKSTSGEGGIFCIFGSRTFVPRSWMCKKQTSVSHSSTESEVISLDADLRMDGLLALDLWDVVIEVLRS